MSGLPLCKYKYQPFKLCPESGEAVKMYGCHLHSAVRLKRISKHGMRPGWDFDQWHNKQEGER